MDDATQILKEHIAALPKELRRYLIANGWTRAVDAIARNFTLDAEQAENLKRETLIVLTGAEDVANLQENVRKALLVAPNDAERIASMVITQAISPVQSVLGKLQNDEVDEQAVPIPPPVEQSEVPADAHKPAVPQTFNMLDDKLANVIKLAPEETHYAEAGMQEPKQPKPALPNASAPTWPGQNTQAPPPTEQSEQPYEPGKDPYREPPV